MGTSHIAKVIGDYVLTYTQDPCYFGHSLHKPSSDFIYVKGGVFSMTKVAYLRFWNSIELKDSNESSKLVVLGEYQSESGLNPLITLNGDVEIHEMPDSYGQQLTFVLVIDIMTLTVIATEILSSEFGDVRCYGMCLDTHGHIVISGSCCTNGIIETQNNYLYSVNDGVCALVATLTTDTFKWTMVKTLVGYSNVTALVQLNGIIYGSASTCIMDSNCMDQDCNCCITSYRVITIPTIGSDVVDTSLIIENKPVGHFLTSIANKLFYITTCFNPPNTKIYRLDKELRFELIDNVTYRTHDVRTSTPFIELLVSDRASQYYLMSITAGGLTKYKLLGAEECYYRLSSFMSTERSLPSGRQIGRSVRISLTFGGTQA